MIQPITPNAAPAISALMSMSIPPSYSPAIVTNDHAWRQMNKAATKKVSKDGI